MGEREYTDPANKTASGHPRMSEEAWASSEQVRETLTAIEKRLDLIQDVRKDLAFLEGRLKKIEEVCSAIPLLAKAVENKASQADLTELGSLASLHTDALLTAIRDLAAKLDGEDVDNLDTDYAATVEAAIVL